MSFAEILDKFSLACICDKNINALKYFDCKQKVSGTQLDLLEDESNKDKILIYSSFDQKKYKLTEKDPNTFLIMKQKIIFLFYQLIIT